MAYAGPDSHRICKECGGSGYVDAAPPPAPATEDVPVDLALIGRHLSSGQRIDRLRIEPSLTEPGGACVEMFLDDNCWANPIRNPDGTVTVLVDGDQRKDVPQ